ncbi:FliM/FliN family flagellar motor C-terminal domain-containing protein [Parvularcula sp. LCG005]|uniref:FliM/FliN family flagellar motor C-terminal domain-containing protein n=1 Tax=Parvularcula sp. LCG005 TaxID=3078805 RepID=UPI002942107B|nr:FliM/FliN family flagellar motor C-terminal domain-containing protein [Parvularcula sp. LCG005]WOI52939.1 FliM/FliN family flagellar motor C-terminal domain-containing protein [Parvularcula sp. LCG005]
MTELSVKRRMTQMTRGLSAPVMAMQPVWLKAAEDSLAALSDILGAAVSIDDLTLRASSTEQYAKDTPEPGLILPLLVDEHLGYQAHIARGDTMHMARLLLRACDQNDIGHDPTMLDGLMLRALYRPLLNAYSSAFNISIALNDELPILDEWPHIRRADIRSFLVVSTKLIVGDQTISLDLCLPNNEPRFAEHPDIAPPRQDAMVAAARSANVEISAVLDSWNVSPGIVAAFKKGTVLPLPGASMEALSLIINQGRRSTTLAHGEHGRSGGSQAIRLSQIESAIR